MSSTDRTAPTGRPALHLIDRAAHLSLVDASVEPSAPQGPPSSLWRLEAEAMYRAANIIRAAADELPFQSDARRHMLDTADDWATCAGMRGIGRPQLTLVEG